MNCLTSDAQARRSPLISNMAWLKAGTLAIGLATMNLLPVAAQATTSLPDGVYLYGQSSQPNQIGKGYFVFEVRQGQALGALYAPHSSFDCAKGKFQANQLALTVVDSYDRTTNPFAIALNKTSTVAANGTPTLQIGLQGFHRLTVTENDRRMLNICKGDLRP